MAKRIIAIMLVLVMTCSVFVGCGNKKTTGTGEVEFADSMEQVADIFANSASFEDDDNGGLGDTSKKGVADALINLGANKNTGTEGLVGNVYTSGFPIVKDKITLEVMAYARESGARDWSKMDFSKDYEELTNIHVEWNVVPQGELADKVKILMSAGDYPDVLCGLTSTMTDAEVLAYGSKGVLWDCSQKLQTYAPNVYNLMAANPEIRTACIEYNGSMFSLPFISRKNPGHFWNINKVWLDELGEPMPATTTDLERVLQLFKKTDLDHDGNPNNQIPFAAYCYEPNFFGPWGLYFEWDNQMMIDEDGKVHYIFGMEEARSCVLYWKRLKKQGLIDVAEGGETVARFNKKLQTGKVGCFMWGMVAYEDCLNIDMLAQYEPMPVPIAPDSDMVNNLKRGTQRYDDALAGRSSFIFGTCKNKEAALRWLDYFYSIEGSLFKTYGKVGGRFLKVNEATGELYTDVPPGTELLDYAPGTIIGGYFGIEVNEALSDNPNKSANDPQVIESKKRVAYTNKAREVFKDALPTTEWPDICYTLEESKEINKYKLYLSYGSGWYTMWAMICGYSDVPDPETGWNTWLNNLKKAGLEKFVAIQQQAYDRNK